MDVAVETRVDIDTTKVERLVNQKLLGWAERTGVIVENRAKSLVGTPGPPHSSPGEPPRRISGALQASIGHQVVTQGELVGVAVYAGTPYALRLELGFFGVDSLGRRYSQAPRPFLRPALIESRSDILAAMRD